jgi:hypothetical protein
MLSISSTVHIWVHSYADSWSLKPKNRFILILSISDSPVRKFEECGNRVDKVTAFHTLQPSMCSHKVIYIIFAAQLLLVFASCKKYEKFAGSFRYSSDVIEGTLFYVSVCNINTHVRRYSLLVKQRERRKLVLE